MYDTIRLHVSDLASKYGFSDGDVTYDPLDELGFDSTADVPYESNFPGEPTRFLGQVVLEELVRRHIAPLVPEIEISYDVNCIHNPVGVWEEVAEEISQDMRYVDVSYEEICAIASAIVTGA